MCFHSVYQCTITSFTTWRTMVFSTPVTLSTCMHYTTSINSSLASFTEAWNDHPFRTANNSSSSQLWIRGMLHHGREMPPSLQGSFDLSNSNNTDPPVPIEQELQRHVNPSDYCDTWGIDLLIHFSFKCVQIIIIIILLLCIYTIVSIQIITTCISPNTLILH